MTRPAIPTIITHDGMTLTLKEWAKRTGIPAFRIYSRLGMGWSVDRALSQIEATENPRTEREKAKFKPALTKAKHYDHDGLSLTLKEWAKRTGINESAIRFRLHSGWSVADALKPRELGDMILNGEKLTFPEIAARTGIPESIIRQRAWRGWDMERIVSQPVRPPRYRKQPTDRTASTEGAGVVSDLRQFQRTGGGRSAQETPNITFPENEAAA